MLDIQDLKVALDSDAGLVKAIDGLQLCIERGETFALVGESGCGKSMTALALMRLLPDNGRVTQGRLDLDGEDVFDLPESRMRAIRGGRIGMIFQEPATSLNPVMRVGDQIEEAVGAHTRLGTRDRQRRALALLERVGIPASARRLRDYPHEFSGGMRQRVLIAAAIASSPRILLADEPTTALDVIIQDQILSLLLELQRDSGMSMILVSHDLGVIAEMCDRIAVMYGGQIVELADARTLLTEPRHPYTISLLRSLPDADRKTKYLQSIPGTPPRLVDIEPGCRFATRCPLAIPECRTWETELLAAPGAHLVRCRRHDDARRPEAWPTQSYESE
jgi:peptide/nickel transport system ATP-binding protein